MAQEVKDELMKTGWKTHAIGRHLVDLPGDAKTIESYKFNEVKVEPLPNIKNKNQFDTMVDRRETELQVARRASGSSMFIERATQSNGSVTLVSWEDPSLEIFYRFDTYFRAGSKSLKYSANVSLNRKKNILDLCDELSREWQEIPSGTIPTSIGFVVDDAILVDKDFNLESWSMSVKFAGKPDVNFTISSFAEETVEKPLRERTAGVHASLLARIAGLSHLRDRERPVGPIWAEEILTAGTHDGKRYYAFKWEAPGKAWSLAEPNLNISLGVIESDYPTNKESFASDDEALELWDAIVDSIRLRPGAV